MNDGGRIVIVSGGRDYRDDAHVCRVLDQEHARAPIGLLVEGGADGVDHIANDWARVRGIDRITVWANWTKWPRAAGPIRNFRMLKLHECRPEGAIFLPGGVGTDDMYGKASRAGLDLRDFRK